VTIDSDEPSWPGLKTIALASMKKGEIARSHELDDRADRTENAPEALDQLAVPFNCLTTVPDRRWLPNGIAISETL